MYLIKFIYLNKRIDFINNDAKYINLGKFH